MSPLTLEDAKRELLAQILAGEAVPCPCCEQLVKIYKRKIASRQAFTLLQVWNAAGQDWCHVPSTVTFTGDSGELSKLRYWGLVEEAEEKRDDGGRAGWWRITDRGRAYVLRQLRVPKYAVLYDGNCLRLEGDLVGITDALGHKFDYADLMSR